MKKIKSILSFVKDLLTTVPEPEVKPQSEIEPTYSGWFDTNDGPMYWFNRHKEWSLKDTVFMPPEIDPLHWYEMAYTPEQIGMDYNRKTGYWEPKKDKKK